MYFFLEYSISIDLHAVWFAISHIRIQPILYFYVYFLVFFLMHKPLPAYVMHFNCLKFSLFWKRINMNASSVKWAVYEKEQFQSFRFNGIFFHYLFSTLMYIALAFISVIFHFMFIFSHLCFCPSTKIVFLFSISIVKAQPTVLTFIFQFLIWLSACVYNWEDENSYDARKLCKQKRSMRYVAFRTMLRFACIIWLLFVSISKPFFSLLFCVFYCKLFAVNVLKMNIKYTTRMYKHHIAQFYIEK